MTDIRGAEAVAILGVNTPPHFSCLRPPLFRAAQKMEVREGVIKRLGGREISRGITKEKMGICKKKKVMKNFWRNV